MKQLKKKIIK